MHVASQPAIITYVNIYSTEFPVREGNKSMTYVSWVDLFLMIIFYR